MPLRNDESCEEKQIIIADIFGDDVLLPKFIDADEAAHDFDIGEAICHLKIAKLVIADLSFGRPSCYYELGMAQALAVPTLLLAEHGTRIFQHSGSVTFYKDFAEFRRIIVGARSKYLSDQFGLRIAEPLG